MARVYENTVKKWAIKAGIPAATVASSIFLIFMYLNSMGLIDITGMSEDQYCAGTCYIYINFTVNDKPITNEDIFIYPIGYDPYGRDTPFEFDPAVKSWKLQRSWGKGWRNLPLNQSCTGTWCGLSNSKDKRIFSVAFREGRDYQIRIEVQKRPLQTVKWWSDDWNIDDPLLLTSVVFNESYCKEWDVRTWTTKELIGTELSLDSKNGTVIPIYEEVEHSEKYCVDEIKAIQIDDKVIDVWKDLQMGMTNDKEVIIDDWLDGNANGICEAGESCCYSTDEIKCYGHRAEDMKKELKEKGIE